MPNAFPVSGNIEPETFPHLLVDLHRRGATGSLKVTGSAHPKALYFRSGRILFGSSNDPRDQLGSILIESGKISREQLDEVNVKVGPGNPLAKVLSESGFVNQRELGDAARIKVERILADLLASEDGAFEFEDGVLPKGAVDLKLSTEKLLLDAVQRVPDRAFALRHVELRTVLEPTPEADAALTEIRGEVWPLLERLDGERSLKDAIALTRLDEFEAAKTACALLFLGAVRKKVTAAAGEELDLAQEAQNGLGGGAPFRPSPSPMASGPAAFVEASDAEDDEGRPFVFPEAAPPPAPEGGATAAYQAIAEAEPDEPFVFSGSAPALSYTPSFPESESESESEAESDEPVAPKEEATGFAVSEPRYEPGMPAEDDTAGPTVILPSLAVADSPTFTMPSPTPRVPSDTQPGSRPLPPLAFEPLPPPAPAPTPMPSPAERQAMPRPNATAPSLPEIPAPPSASRPTREDLAALDALLASPGRSAKAPERASSTGWEPQFRPRTAPPRRMPARTGAPSGSSRVPLLLTGAVGVLMATAAAWYFLLRQPSPPPTAGPGEAPTSIDAPATLASGATRPATTTPSAAPPTTVATQPPPTTTAPVTQPPPTPPPTPAPTPVRQTTPLPTRASSAGDARGLLRQGSLPEAARAFAAALAPSRGAHSIQILTACSPETVQKAVGAAGSDELFILPVVLTGRACFRVCWGVYDTRPAAEAALGRVPAYFREGGAKPRVSSLGELLP